MTIQWQYSPAQMQVTSALSPFPTPYYLKERRFDHPKTIANVITEMKRIVIIGSSGSGKSTLARQLGHSLKLPVIHLDKHFWHPGWVGTPHDIWEAKVREMVSGEQWIIDGNYRGTLDIRLRAADTVIFLDLPRWVCAWRATKRRVQYANTPRPDIAEGCREPVLDPTLPRFLHRILDYPDRARPDVLQKIEDWAVDKRFIWLKSTTDVNRFLARPYQWTNNAGHTNNWQEYIARIDG